MRGLLSGCAEDEEGFVVSRFGPVLEGPDEPRARGGSGLFPPFVGGFEVGRNCGVVALKRLEPGTGVDMPLNGVIAPGIGVRFPGCADFSMFSRASARKCRKS